MHYIEEIIRRIAMVFFGQAAETVRAKALEMLGNFGREDLLKLMLAAGWQLIETLPPEQQHTVLSPGADQLFFRKGERTVMICVDRETDRADGKVDPRFFLEQGYVLLILTPYNLSWEEGVMLEEKIPLKLARLPECLGKKLGFVADVRKTVTAHKAEIEKFLESIEEKE